MYQLTDVIDTNTMQTKKDAWNLIGKDFELHDAEVGKQAKLNNMSDAHMYHRVTKTSIVDSVKKSFKDVCLVAKDTMYILKKY
jgi:hypothetical protein